MDDEITDETRILGRRPGAKSPPPIDPEATTLDTDLTQPTRPTRPADLSGVPTRPIESTPPAQEPPAEVQSSLPSDEETVLVPQGDETVIYRGPGKTGSEPPSLPETTDAPKSASADSADLKDPVVGFLVVTKGPGRGKYVGIGHNQNTIGRQSSRVRIDFGDGTIARDNHCIISYEPRGREYVLRPGTSNNMTYVNGDAVYEPVRLKPYDNIELGATHLLFLPLCGADFSWDDDSDAAE
ncbi:MAG: FHA domain-containing protein [Verrucomicrobiota bacterium]